MPPAYVKPYVKRQKNDMANAEGSEWAMSTGPRATFAFLALIGRASVGHVGNAVLADLPPARRAVAFDAERRAGENSRHIAAVNLPTGECRRHRAKRHRKYKAGADKRPGALA